ncbi:related to Dolichyl-diphosphooligosaccharide--protein glycosyltransferase subunit WBP1 [Zygosaccharomyces bailii ISA1307]|uniref:Dolichyl-diphosphooligosaccharide--protein glycosyltransferase subunit WBP1 n=1 Tax=Zygosaccharomyces bailii (strain CLIB 213 / ATCC 58445 / CBS 680 / BCRC 21525 / NBRC 1098 / NCYC 1416 / NRRL Y-2227) TaxID=1333698 RepID=A0A8J2XAQ0_ZYGB2|nr:ZYBA0S12-03092g1_1 [Zygosaccharomyces bailii CLIB 213]CDH17274.1 related to Dolichyl-diphosphooligosaccharide--protein glycosyltransferase subunit WBP1 [Zygosaccharomyces bailii ISA1307]
MLGVFISLLMALCGNIYAASVHPSRTLVLYDERLDQLGDFSRFFDNLKEREYDMHFSSANSSARIDLYEGEHRLYDNLVVLPVKGKQVNKLIPVDLLLQFYNDGGDVLSVTDPAAVCDSVRLFLNQLGIYPSPRGYELVDNVKENLVFGPNELKNYHIHATKGDKSLFVQNASAALLDNRQQLVPILAAPRTSFTRAAGKDAWTVGSQGFLAAGFQNLNNARVVWLGSVDFLKDAFYDNNGEFAQELAKWVFREKNVIKSLEPTHSHADGTTYETLPYKIKDIVVYEIGFSEWNGKKWQPYIADDIQFELRMLDPYYRLTLKPGRKEEQVQYYTTGEFNLPDHHGVFTFQTDYKRDGFSFVVQKDVRAIRNLAHSEYARSSEISNAAVYLTGIFAVIFAWIIFIIFFITAPPTIVKTVSSKKKNN